MAIHKLIVVVLPAMVALSAAAPAEEGERGLAVTNPVAREECGSCHVPYSPQFLPARSWRSLMTTLDDHFGEDASVSDEARQKILDYLTANASNVSHTRAARAFARGLTPLDTPLRVTSTPMWVAIHRELDSRWWSDPRVKSKANCSACHRHAADGFYGDDD